MPCSSSAESPPDRIAPEARTAKEPTHGFEQPLHAWEKNFAVPVEDGNDGLFLFQRKGDFVLNVRGLDRRGRQHHEHARAIAECVLHSTRPSLARFDIELVEPQLAPDAFKSAARRSTNSESSRL